VTAQTDYFTTDACRPVRIDAAVARFWQMLEDAPDHMPRVMPMTAAVAPAFATRYPEVAIIFDNLHSLHDVISDILAAPDVPRARKRDEILRAAARYRDATSFVMMQDEWLEMSHMMGVENMGGPAVGIMASLPQPTVERGAVMSAHAAHGQPAAGRDSARVAAQSRGARPTPGLRQHTDRFGGRGDSTRAISPRAGSRRQCDGADLLAPDATVVEAGGIETRAKYLEHHLPAISPTRAPSLRNANSCVCPYRAMWRWPSRAVRRAAVPRSGSGLAGFSVGRAHTRRGWLAHNGHPLVVTKSPLIMCTKPVGRGRLVPTP
jgi:hypothetical protein